jgi:uncharacterized integral membrane protein
MRYIRYLFLAALGVCLLTVAIANRTEVTLNLLPDELGTFLGWAPTITLPMFLVIFAGIVAGILIGFVWEWLREHKHRAEAAHQRREKERLEQEMTRIKGPKARRNDDVLALLDETGATH